MAMPSDDLPPLPGPESGEDVVVGESAKGTQERPSVSAKEFFETIPPGSTANVTGVLSVVQHMSPMQFQFNEIDLDLYCATPVKCAGIRSFRKSGSDGWIGSAQNYHFSAHVRFLCRNCEKSVKLYSLLVVQKPGVAVAITKLAEVPEFGPPTSARVFKLIGPDRDYYLKGRRSENQGLGIGAFGYYRRVVENQKNRILDEIIRAARRIGGADDIIADLEAAKNETQLSEAIRRVRAGFPPALLIKGHNPLTLLHSALSEGMHAETDEECLEMATTVRVVLTDLADRISHALKDHAQLDDAVTKLLARKAKKGSGETPPEK